jgi:bifunctional N-acetylglucosamine-1-phosphate-uridyltransferase/glucosamine-1-phosphate-acetyltransferase GlmU-like protein
LRRLLPALAPLRARLWVDNQAVFIPQINMTAPLDIVVMAAGKGTRMKSRHPKVLQKLAGRALLQHVLDTAAQLKARSAVVVTGHGAAEVEAAIAAAAAMARMAPMLQWT